MRKRIIGTRSARERISAQEDWLNLESLARAELSSEDPTHPIEAALQPESNAGWRAQDPGPQTVRLLFDEPSRVRCIRLVFREAEIPRTQEFVLRWRSSANPDFREIVRQQFHFSPLGATEEVEEYSVELDALTELELSIVPDISGGPARASLRQLRVG